MYSRFQTLVSGLQILKKIYVASDHVSKILRSLPARWRPRVTAIEEAKDLNTLSVEDLVSSLKVLGLEHNLLSISQFYDNGYDVMFGKTNCTIINKDNKSIVFKGKRVENVYKINFF